MKIIRNSWHHQLYTTFDTSRHFRKETNLCEYLRGVFIGLFWVSILSLAISIVIISLLEPIVGYIAYKIVGISYIYFFGEFFYLLGVAFYIFIGFFGIVGLFRWFSPKVASSMPGNFKMPKLSEDSFYYIAKAAIKDKHDKVCRTITIGE